MRFRGGVAYTDLAVGPWLTAGISCVPPAMLEVAASSFAVAVLSRGAATETAFGSEPVFCAVAAAHRAPPTVSLAPDIQLCPAVLRCAVALRLSSMSCALRSAAILFSPSLFFLLDWCVNALVISSSLFVEPFLSGSFFSHLIL